MRFHRQLAGKEDIRFWERERDEIEHGPMP